MEFSKTESSADGATFVSSHGRHDDDRFFMDNAFVVILIENVFFRLPVNKLQKVSEFFEKEIACPLTSESPGFCRENPMDLTKDASAAEFRILLNLIFANDVDNRNPEYSCGDKEWLVVLKLASTWNIPSYRDMAIKYLRPSLIDGRQLVELGRKYSVTNFVRDGYKELIRRVTTIEATDVNLLGYETIIKLFQLREADLRRRHAHNYVGPEMDIERAFAEELGGLTLRETILSSKR
ncbi:hypothetical protein CPB83DRAFT_800575 [Crepidotus variabilis]|uniref:BTB domain-containing protein n=1 Tax=Crepidotus variabilis TaxID=179855 RepID=A0A9P6E4R3_9AGAR|nr:hypothetical protein CPB83DRAFT_800575 [Crepidotus variabilis]